MLAACRINILSRFNVREMVQAAINQTINGRCKIEDCFSLGHAASPVLSVVSRCWKWSHVTTPAQHLY